MGSFFKTKDTILSCEVPFEKNIVEDKKNIDKIIDKVKNNSSN